MSDKTDSNNEMPDDSLKLYRLIGIFVKEESDKYANKTNMLPGIEPEQATNNKLRNDIQESLDSINLTSGAILALARTLSGFHLDSETNNVIPGELKNGFITGGLLHALEKLAEDLGGSIEFLEEQHRDNAKQ